MKLEKYYDIGRYFEHYTTWREKEYFPNRIKLFVKNLPVNFSGKILDAGCGDGTMLSNIKKNNSKIKPYGVDISKKGCEIARKKGIKTRVADLNNKIPFFKNSFNFVIAHEVIEHLTDPDQFLEECHRVLKKNGYLIITTPNLTAWYHRLLFLFGFYPLFSELSTRNRQVGIGPLKKIIKNVQPVGHIRIFTVSALKDMLKLYGFKVVKVKGSAVSTAFPRVIKWIFEGIDSLWSQIPSLSSNILIIGQRK